MVAPILRQFTHTTDFDVEMPLHALIESLIDTKQRLEAEGWSELFAEREEGETWYDDSERGRDTVAIRGKRLETQEEADKREAERIENEARRERYARQQYEALKVKFEGK